MPNSNFKILVLFVEPMLYIYDLIREVYDKTEFEFRYIFCSKGITGKDNLVLPDNSVLCSGNNRKKKRMVINEISNYSPDLVIINGYVGLEQTVAIKYCKSNKIKYAIETDTPLHIPQNPIKAFLKKVYLRSLLKNELCYGLPGGTLQLDNLSYYGIAKSKCFIMPMSVSYVRMREEYNSLPPKNVLKEKYNNGGKKIILFIGRLEEVKNVELLLEAFAEIVKTHKDTVLFIVGDGTLRQNLKNYCLTHQIKDVYFFGYITFPKIVELYKVSDLFVLPSKYEPWGLVVNEALTMFLPVIVSSEVGCRVDLIEEGENGFIFDNNSKEDLKLKIETCLNTSLQKMSEGASRKISCWNFDTYLKNFLQFIYHVNKAKQL